LEKIFWNWQTHDLGIFNKQIYWHFLGWVLEHINSFTLKCLATDRWQAEFLIKLLILINLLTLLGIKIGEISKRKVIKEFLIKPIYWHFLGWILGLVLRMSE
jgi:hypothetical protein